MIVPFALQSYEIKLTKPKKIEIKYAKSKTPIE